MGKSVLRRRPPMRYHLTPDPAESGQSVGRGTGRTAAAIGESGSAGRPGIPSPHPDTAMLETPGRYDYSPITERTDYTWPDGHV